MKSENKTLSKFLNELLQDATQKKELEKLVEVEEVYRYLMKRGYKKDFNEFKIELGEIMKKYLKLQNISEKDLESVAGGTKTGKRITSMALTALMLANSGAGAINVEMKQKPTAQAKKFISDVLNKGKNFVQSGKKFIQADKNKPLVAAVGASLATVAGTAALVATTGGLYAAYKNFIDIFELTETNGDLQKATSLLRILELAANIKFKSGSTTELDAEYVKEFARALANSLFRDVEINDSMGSLMDYYNDLTDGLVKSEQVYKLTLVSIYYSGILDMEVKSKFGKNKPIISINDAIAIKCEIISVAYKDCSGDNLQKSYNEICTKVRTLLNKSIDDLRSTEKEVTKENDKSLESTVELLAGIKKKVKNRPDDSQNYKNDLERLLKEINNKKEMLEKSGASKKTIGKLCIAEDEIKTAISYAEEMKDNDDEEVKTLIIDRIKEATDKAELAIDRANSAIDKAKQEPDKEEENTNSSEDSLESVFDSLSEQELKDLKDEIIKLKNDIIFIQFKLNKLNKFLPKNIDEPWATARNELASIFGKPGEEKDKKFGFNEMKKSIEIILKLLNNKDAKLAMGRFSSSLNQYLCNINSENDMDFELLIYNDQAMGSTIDSLKKLEENLKDMKYNIEIFGNVTKNFKIYSNAKIERSTLERLKKALEDLKIKVEIDEKLTNKCYFAETELQETISELNSIIGKFEQDQKYTVTFEEVRFIFRNFADHMEDHRSILDCFDNAAINELDEVKKVVAINELDEVKKVSSILSLDELDIYKVPLDDDNRNLLFGENLNLACGMLELVEKLAKETIEEYNTTKYKANFKKALNNGIIPWMNFMKNGMEEFLCCCSSQIKDKEKLETQIKAFDETIKKLTQLNILNEDELLTNNNIKILFGSIKKLFDNIDEISEISEIDTTNMNANIAEFAQNGVFNLEAMAETISNIGVVAFGLRDEYYNKTVNCQKSIMKAKIKEIADKLKDLQSCFCKHQDLFITENKFQQVNQALNNAIQELNKIEPETEAELEKIGNKIIKAYDYIKNEIELFEEKTIYLDLNDTYGFKPLYNSTYTLRNEFSSNNICQANSGLEYFKNNIANNIERFEILLDIVSNEKKCSKYEEYSKEEYYDLVKQGLENLKGLLELEKNLLSHGDHHFWPRPRVYYANKKLDKLQSIIDLLKEGSACPFDVINNISSLLNYSGRSNDIGREARTFDSMVSFSKGNSKEIFNYEILYYRKVMWDAINKLVSEGLKKAYEEECTEIFKRFFGGIRNYFYDFTSSIEVFEKNSNAKLDKINPHLKKCKGNEIEKAFNLNSEEVTSEFTHILNIFKVLKEDIEATKCEHKVSFDELETNLTLLSSGKNPEKLGETFEQVSKVLEALIGDLKQKNSNNSVK